MAKAFVGRKQQLAALGAALEQARSAAPRIVLVEGPAGVGKSMLLRRIGDLATGAMVLTAAGDEDGAALSFAVLDQLLADAGAPPATPALDATRAGMRFLDLLGALQDSGPVVLVVDDAHWADAPSMQGLVFALRRLRVDRVLAVFASRDSELERLPAGLLRLSESEHGIRLPLGGLQPGELRELAFALGAGSLNMVGARQLHDHTAGNPLYATALLEEYGAEVLSRQDAVMLPPPRAFAEVVLDRLGSCSAAARALVEAGAVLGGRFSVALAAAVSEVQDALHAAEEAVANRLLTPERDPQWMMFAHPLVRAAVHQQLTPERRAALHLRVADRVDEEALALHHRASAAQDPDPELASALDAFANQRAEIADWSGAAEASLAAARLTPPGPPRERRLARAYEMLACSGRVTDALAVADQTGSWTDEALACLVRAQRLTLTGPCHEIPVLLARAREVCDAEADPKLAHDIDFFLAQDAMLNGRGEEAIAAGRRRVETDGYVSHILMIGLATLGRAQEALDLVASLPDPFPDISSTAHAVPLVSRGIVRRYVDDLHGSRRDLETCVRSGRLRAPVSWLEFAAFHLSETYYRLGRWDNAVVQSEFALSAFEGTYGRAWASERHATAAFPLAARGDPAAATHVRIARDAADDNLSFTLYAAVAGARVAQALGDPARQAAACEPLLRYVGRDLIDEPGIHCWRDLYAEALVGLGRVDEADAVLTVLEARAEARGLASARSAAARVRGLAEGARGNTAGARDAFETAVAEAVLVDMPFLRAQAGLDYGAFLRRHGGRRDAVAHLRGAREILEQLGAHPYLARCDAELAAIGVGASTQQVQALPPRLTPHEKAIAHLVADGATNREAAQELVLSVKTVEYHLGNVFTKLGVRSRAQLAARLATVTLGEPRATAQA